MRRLASGEIADLLAEQQTSMSEVQDQNEANRGIEAQISRIRKKWRISRPNLLKSRCRFLNL